jgi:hypothetical protein
MIAGVVLSTGVAVTAMIAIFITSIFSPNVRINGGSRINGYLERSWGIQLSKK